MSSNVGSAGQVRTKEPRPGKPTWEPATPRRPGWETESRIWTGELPPAIPPKPSGPRWRVKRWMQLYAEGETR